MNAIRRSLRLKVIAVVLAATLVALLVSGTTLLVSEITRARDFLARDVETQADILALANAPALTFDDRESAAVNLAQLEGRPGFRAAALYTADGRLFASHSAGGADTTFPPVSTVYEPIIAGGGLSMFRPIVEAGNRIGTVYLSVSYDLAERLSNYAVVLVLAMLGSFVVATLISLTLARSVTAPISDVTRIAHRVIEERDFALRARKTTQDESGILVEAFNAMLDEVERRSAELHASNALLLRETEIRRETEAALRETDKRKDEFLATIAHELRNPLAPIVNATSLLHASNGTPETAQRAREIIDRQLAQLVRLVDDLLDVSRITSGKLIVRKEPVELASIIRNAVDTVGPTLDATGHRLTTSLPDRPIALYADPVRLSQVFSNLLHNAIKYSDAGGRIELAASVEGNDKIRVTIRDEGRGIAAATLPRIFEMFAQGDGSNDQVQTGLGVGLALARRLVELHDGAIGAESAGLGKGSTFTVELPLGGAPAVEPRKPSSEPHGRSHRVLLVDDNLDFTASLTHLLRMLGHTVQTAHDPEEAVQIAREFKPEFGLLDIGLPRISGYDLARKLHDQPETAGAVLIAISGWGQPQHRQRSREAGFALHLVKPIELEDIQAAFRSLAREES